MGEGSCWRKSSYSNGETHSDCVELGQAPGAVLIRDTKDHGHGPVLQVSPAAWHRFASTLKI
jgi:hypothetical protein